MHQAQDKLTITTPGRGFTDVTREVRAFSRRIDAKPG
jgi:thiamine phosphate synthase YjbQ (UPF0047 family)